MVIVLAGTWMIAGLLITHFTQTVGDIILGKPVGQSFNEMNWLDIFIFSLFFPLTSVSYITSMTLVYLLIFRGLR